MGSTSTYAFFLLSCGFCVEVGKRPAFPKRLLLLLLLVVVVVDVVVRLQIFLDRGKKKKKAATRTRTRTHNRLSKNGDGFSEPAWRGRGEPKKQDGLPPPLTYIYTHEAQPGHNYCACIVFSTAWLAAFPLE